jgi:hypothetical protein
VPENQPSSAPGADGAELLGRDARHAQRLRVRHRKKISWFSKPQSRRMKIVILLGALLALALAFALVHFLETPPVQAPPLQ